MDLQLTHKVAIVTAASKGLGKAAAREFARNGARIAICARSSALDVTAQEIRQETDAEVLAVKADLTRQADIDGFVNTTLDKWGQIDILVINSGGPPPGDFLSISISDWEAAIDLILMSAVRLCYAVVPHMIERGTGSIVASESVSIKQPIKNLILSNSIRLAVIGLLKSLANELGPKGIRVNSINPGPVLTDRLEQLVAVQADANGTSIEQELSNMATEIPLKRVATAEEYGRAVAWLASPTASYIHGHALFFDGGLVQSPL